jgi:hypothetical protein
MCTNHLEKMICLEDSTRISKKHQLKQQFLAKKAEAELANSLPDNSDLLEVTGLQYEDFINEEGNVDYEAVKYQYEFAFSFCKNTLTVTSKLFQQLNLTEHLAL